MNTPHLDPNDPRLTAYALGELDASEAAEIETLLEQNDEARRVVDEIRATADALRSELSAEPAPAMTGEQRDAIEQAMAEGAADGDEERPAVIGRIGGAWRSGDFWIGAALSGIAATLIVGLFGPGMFEGPATGPLALESSGEDSTAMRGVRESRNAGDRDQTTRDGTQAGRGAAASPSAEGERTSTLSAQAAPKSEMASEPRAVALEDQVTGAVDEETVSLARELLERRDRSRQAEATQEHLGQLAPAEAAPGLELVDGYYRDAEADAQRPDASREYGEGAGFAGGFEGRGVPAAESEQKGRRDNLYALITSETADADAPARAAPRDRSASLGAVPVVGEAFRGEVDDSRAHGVDRRVALNSFNTEQYARITDNPFEYVVDSPLSTFSIDVDTASYSNLRRYLNEVGTLPPPDAVRIEELINYFRYDYEPPATVNASGDLDEVDEGTAPFAAHVEVGPTPWAEGRRLVRIGLKGMEVDMNDRPAANLVFLLDVSGSMRPQNKLPLVKQAMTSLVESLGVDDYVSIVTYAGDSQIALHSTPVAKRTEITAAIDRLRAGGSTNGEGGIQAAYRVATENFIDGGFNRVILCTDGDFNVGVTDNGQLTRLIEEKAKSGVYLSVLGFGMGNYKDDRLEELSNKGNGNYAYLDNYDEAHKVLVEQMGGTLITIAKDVKIQVEFNPAEVAGYRLIGYGNRMLEARDFNDDTKDAGEIGAGHTVTALYEIVPAPDKPGAAVDEPLEPQEVDPLRYQRPAELTESAVESGELLTVKLRYKRPDEDTSTLIEFPVTDEGKTLEQTSNDFRFAAAVAEFGMLLRNSPYKGAASWANAIDLAAGALGEDEEMNRRAEFLSLVTHAKRLVERADEEETEADAESGSGAK